MPKTREIPLNMREFNSLFSILARKHDAARVFDDFLTLVVCVLARQTQEEWYLDTIRKYDEDDINIFPKLLGCLFIIYENEITEGYWSDPLGTFYEILTGNYKKSKLGQFFTPPALCDMMAMLTIPKGTFGKTVSEPTCGSGRAILAIHHHSPGNHFTACDLDHMCVKMTCINMAMHGIKGDVFHMNTLTLETYSKYVINHDYHTTKTPFVYKIKDQ